MCYPDIDALLLKILQYIKPLRLLIVQYWLPYPFVHFRKRIIKTEYIPYCTFSPKGVPTYRGFIFLIKEGNDFYLRSTFGAETKVDLPRNIRQIGLLSQSLDNVGYSDSAVVATCFSADKTVMHITVNITLYCYDFTRQKWSIFELLEYLVHKGDFPIDFFFRHAFHVPVKNSIFLGLVTEWSWYQYDFKNNGTSYVKPISSKLAGALFLHPQTLQIFQNNLFAFTSSDRRYQLRNLNDEVNVDYTSLAEYYKVPAKLYQLDLASRNWDCTHSVLACFIKKWCRKPKLLYWDRICKVSYCFEAPYLHSFEKAEIHVGGNQQMLVTNEQKFFLLTF